MSVASATPLPKHQAVEGAVDAKETVEGGTPVEEGGNGGAGASVPTPLPPPVDQDKGLVDEEENKSPPQATPLLVLEDGANLPCYVRTPPTPCWPASTRNMSTTTMGPT